MSADLFFDAAEKKLAEVREAEAGAVAAAAEAMTKAIAGGGLVHVFGTGHSALLAMDIFYRAGGLMPVHPLFDDRVILNYAPPTATTEWEKKEGWAGELVAKAGVQPGDVMIVISTSGKNGAPIDVALAAKQAGLTLIALTSRAYAAASPPGHSSGKRLHEIADIVLDNRVDPGDAAISLPGLEQKVAPLSTVIGSALLQACVVQVTANLLARGETPPVFISSNLPGGPEHNDRMMARYGERIRFLTEA
jgi:uncharacterized phosphosugar-binding protein